MVKGRRVDELFDRLSKLRTQPPRPETRKELSLGLASRVNFIAAKAADLARELKLADLCPDLRQAFDRYLSDKKLEDKGCAAKTAIARAAVELQCPAEDLFLAGIRHVQMEGSFGPPVDVAAELRGLCALGLVQVRHRQVMTELVDLLADPAPQARVGAARALAYAGRPEGALVLRFKLLAGEDEFDVLSECCIGVLQLDPEPSLPFLDHLIDSGGPTARDAAALALGSCRRPEALDLLRRHYSPDMDFEFRPTLLLAIATLRFPQALDFVESLVEKGRPPAATDALKALRIYRNDKALTDRLAVIVQCRQDEKLSSLFASEFDPR